MLYWLVSSSFLRSFAVAEEKGGGGGSCFSGAVSHRSFPCPEVRVSVSLHRGGLICRNPLLPFTTSFYHFYTTSGRVESEVKGESLLAFTLLLF